MQLRTRLAYLNTTYCKPPFMEKSRNPFCLASLHRCPSHRRQGRDDQKGEGGPAGGYRRSASAKPRALCALRAFERAKVGADGRRLHVAERRLVVVVWQLAAGAEVVKRHASVEVWVPRDCGGCLCAPHVRDEDFPESSWGAGSRPLERGRRLD